MNMYKNKNKGFTIIELIVVIAIIAILAVIIIGSVRQYIQKAKDTRAAASLNQIAIAGTQYSGKTGNWADSVANPGELPAFVPEFYAASGYNANYYCDDCEYFWQNYPNENGNCVVVDIVDTANNNALKSRKCVATAGCPDCPDDISDAQNAGIEQTLTTFFTSVRDSAEQYYAINGMWPGDVNPGEQPEFYTGSWDASYYCEGCLYDYEDWTGSCPNPCVFIDIRDASWNILGWEAIATSGCVGDPPQEGQCQY